MTTVSQYLRRRFDRTLASAWASIRIEEALVALSFIDDGIATAEELVARGEEAAPLTSLLMEALDGVRGLPIAARLRMVRPFWGLPQRPD